MSTRQLTWALSIAALVGALIGGIGGTVSAHPPSACPSPAAGPVNAEKSSEYLVSYGRSGQESSSAVGTVHIQANSFAEATLRAPGVVPQGMSVTGVAFQWRFNEAKSYNEGE